VVANVRHYSSAPVDNFITFEDFVAHAPAGTRFRFGGESHFWQSRGNGLWDAQNVKSKGWSYLRYYFRKGIDLEVGSIVEPKAGSLSISQLVSLEKWVNERLEEAYERGRKDGAANQEVERFSDTWYNVYDEGYGTGYESGYESGYQAGQAERE
jgi:hypothetical protein